MTPQSFTSFPRLPAEVRCCIWRLALRQPRVHRLRASNTALEQPQHSLMRTETLSRSTVTTRDVLATCQESRREALRDLPDTLRLSECMVHFNGAEDVICLVKLNLNMLDGMIEARLRRQALEPGIQNGGAISEMPLALDWVNTVTRLALEARNADFHDDFAFFTTEEINLDRLVRFMSKFPKLKWLFLIVVPLPDDMETVVVQETDNGNKEKREGEGDEDANDVCGNGDNDIGGDWIRGENGINDWYRWVPPSTTWDHSNGKVEEHFSDMARWKALPSSRDAAAGG